MGDVPYSLPLQSGVDLGGDVPYSLPLQSGVDLGGGCSLQLTLAVRGGFRWGCSLQLTLAVLTAGGRVLVSGGVPRAGNTEIVAGLRLVASNRTLLTPAVFGAVVRTRQAHLCKRYITIVAYL